MPTTERQHHRNRNRSSNTRTTYTLGPEGGDYDIPWAAGENATVSGDEPPRIVVTHDAAHFLGRIEFTGPNDVLNVELPAELAAAAAVAFPVAGVDLGDGIDLDSAIVGVNGRALTVTPDYEGFSDGDRVQLSGSYLLA
jgi:hypothetical protein